MSDDEARAEQAAYDSWLPTYHGRYLGEAFREGWLAGRNWQRAQSRAALEAGQEVTRLRAALQTIRDHYGKVCADYALCRHVGCESSVGAWMEADRALSTSGGAES